MLLKLVSLAELKMHRVASVSGPLAAPDKARVFEDFHDTFIHIASCPLFIGPRINVDCNSPGMGGQLGSIALLAELKTAAVRLNPVSQPLIQNFLENSFEMLP